MNIVTNDTCPVQDGQLRRLKSLIASSPASINARCPSSGDTPLIVAAREGHAEVVEFLLRQGADVTIQNDVDETAMEVTTEKIRNLILGLFPLVPSLFHNL